MGNSDGTEQGEPELELELLPIPTFAGLDVVNSHVCRLTDSLLKSGTYE